MLKPVDRKVQSVAQGADKMLIGNSLKSNKDSVFEGRRSIICGIHKSYRQ